MYVCGDICYGTVPWGMEALVVIPYVYWKSFNLNFGMPRAFEIKIGVKFSGVYYVVNY